MEWFVGARWDTFCFAFQRFSYEVARAFEKWFDGKTAWVGDLTLHVTKDFMATTTSIPTICERWFKNKSIIGVYINQFLKGEHQDAYFSKGIMRNWMK